MNETVQVSLVQFNSAWLDRSTNSDRMAEFVETESRDHNANLVVFPEMASTGYMPKNPDSDFVRKMLEQAETIPGPTTEALGEVAKRYGTHVIVGITQLHPTIPNILYNSAAFIGPDGNLIGTYQKVHGALEEKNVFTPGDKIPVFKSELGAIAPNICYDVRFPELTRVQALNGAEIMVAIWAMYEQPGKAPSDSIKIRCRSRATENFMYVLGCNRSGREGDRVFFGRSIIAAPSGEVIAESNTDEEEVIRGTLTNAALRDQRMYITIFGDRRPDLYGAITNPR
jgi:omega-amidase